jgi:hypothetical protein
MQPAQSLLSVQFQHIAGFQDTILGHNLNFKSVDPNVSSVQILHTGETEHWVCTCSLKGSSAVMVMDSMALFLSLNNSTILQISKIYRVPNSTLEIRTVSVQQQKGSSDCGVFAVAYAVEVCLGRNPQYARFDQTRMRNHLYECLTEGVMKPFPRSDYETLPRPSPLVLHIKIYCECRMPEDYDENMVCCDGCEDWYHMSCVNLKKISFLRDGCVMFVK